MTTPLTLETILTNYPQVFDDSIGKFEGELHLHTSNDVIPHKTAPIERATFCHGVELSYCLVTVRALTETAYEIFAETIRHIIP